MAFNLTLKDLKAAGLHYGYDTQRLHPKMRKYINGKKNNLYFINLEETLLGLKRAYEFVKKIASENGKILFVGTKKAVSQIVKESAQEVNMPYITTRWLGGTLTNFQTIKNSIERFKNYQKMQQEGIIEKLSKKEQAYIKKKLNRLEKFIGGLVDLEDLPDCLFVIDVKKEEKAVREGILKKIPVIGVVDIDANPEIIDYPIIANDESPKSIKLITESIVSAIKEGLKEVKEKTEVKEILMPKEEKLEVIGVISKEIQEDITGEIPKEELIEKDEDK